MRLGETAGALYGTSFLVQEGYRTPGFPLREAVIDLEAIDGSVFDTIHMGARQARRCVFTLAYMTPAQYAALQSFTEANAGQKVRVELEHAGERVFGELLPGPVMYAYLVKAEPLGETRFSQDHQDFGLALEMEYAGPTADSVPNAVDTCLYDFLVKIDCVQATPGCTALNLAALNALTGVVGGSIGLTTTDRKVYFYNPEKPGGAGWDYQYTLPANMPSMGLKNGVIRLSSFADISAASPGMDGEDWKSGWIPERGITFPKYSIDARTGPAVEHPEGFGFAIDNSSEVWKFPVENNISFYGARCELYVYDRQAARLVKLRSGYNNQNAFDTAVLKFKVEPGILFQNKSFPAAVVGPDNFPDASKKARGKTVQATFGRWEKGALQAVAFENASVRFPDGRRYLNLVSWDGGTRQLVLDMTAAQVQTVLGYPVGDYPQGIGRILYVMIHSMPGNPEAKLLKKVTALAAASGNIRFTLEKPFEVSPDATALFLVHLANNQIIVDGEATVGMRTAGYLTGSAAGGLAPLEFFGKVEDTLYPIPDSAFRAVEDGEENKVVIDHRFLALEDDGTIVLKDRVPLSQVDPKYIHGIVDQQNIEGPGGSGDRIDVFNHGFSVDGVESNEVNVTPFPRLAKWGDKGGQGYRGPNLFLPGDGKLIAAFSADRTVLAWTPMQGASEYRLTRYTVQLGGWDQKSRSQRPDVVTQDMGFGVAGIATVSGAQNNLYIDASVDAASPLAYEYRIEPILTDSFVAPIASNRGFNRPKAAGAPVILVVGKSTGATLIWSVPDVQAGFTVFRDGTSIATVVSATQGYYQATGLTNGTEYTFKVAVQTLLTGSGGDRWFQRTGTVGFPTWWLLPASATNAAAAIQDVFFDKKESDTTFEGWRYSWAYKVTRRTLDAADHPAAGLVFSWMWKVDHTLLPDMSGAKDVALLGNFVVRSHYGNTQVPILIQCRLIKRDRTSAQVIQYPEDPGGLACKLPTEPGATGAYAVFANLPAEKGGSDAQYDTDAIASDPDAIYTGKGLWKLSDHLFEDDAFIWKQVEYVMFSVTNAVAVPEAAVRPGPGGYRIGLGGPWGATWTQVAAHKFELYLEFTREFKAGLEEPPFGRIDGGRVDDAAGTITGTPNKIIEKARHIVDLVVHKTLGYKPTYIRGEMDSRNGWIWRWQPRESRSIQEHLHTFARNLDALVTFTPDDQICIRNYGIDELGVDPVFTFTESNILVDSWGDPEYRRRNEIYQRILAKFNVEPSEEDKATEEMLIGWDMVRSKPIFGGYQRVTENADGVLVDQDSLDGLDVLCRLSTYLYAAGGKVNEYGIGPGKEEVYEMFYRPTRPGPATGLPIERDLPNLKVLWPDAQQPKQAMQARFRRLVKSLVFDSWYFPIACSMRNVIYNPAVAGYLNESETAEHRIKLGDLIAIRGRKTSEQTLRGQVLGMSLSSLYDGYAVLEVFCPRPPGQFGPFVDPNWDAGGPGARNEADFVFKGNLYGLLGEDGTFADAGGPGARDEAQYRFPDGTTADAQGSGSGKA